MPCATAKDRVSAIFVMSASAKWTRGGNPTQQIEELHGCARGRVLPSFLSWGVQGVQLFVMLDQVV